MKKMLILSCLSMAVISIVSCNTEADFAPISGKQITLSVGFEDQMSMDAPQQASTRTYLQNEQAVQWGSTPQDKVIYVFDSNGAKNVFEAVGPLDDSGNLKNFPQREFKGSISEDSEINYVIWTGFAANQDQCTLSNGVFSGSTLKVENPQTVTNGKSFDNTSNIAVMKPGDDVLRNVFGYIQYTVPAIPGGNTGAIKSVTFSATENLSGNLQIDYTGDDPVTTIVANGNKSLTVNTRDKSGLEAGNHYAVLPAGTYTNFNIKVTLVDDTSFDLPVSDPVTIVRGKYTTAGTLPAEAPNPPVEPEEPGESFEWPNDPAAFDYGLTSGQTRRQSYPEEEFTAAGITAKEQFKEDKVFVADGITYCGSATYSGNRVAVEQVQPTGGQAGGYWSEEYRDIIPSARYQSFKINRPGTIYFYPAIAENSVNRSPTYYLAVITKKNGVTTAQIVDQVTPTEESTTRPGNPYDSSVYDSIKNYFVTLSVSEDDLYGIEEAATVYLYHKNATKNTLSVNYFPFTWTVAE